MGFVEDRSHLKNQYAAGSMWRPGSAAIGMKPQPSMFVQNKTFMSRPNAVFSAGWRDSVRSARDPRARQAANAIESSQRRLERKMAEQDVICMNLNHSSHALIAVSYTHLTLPTILLV